jgi:hypothetical protein
MILQDANHKSESRVSCVPSGCLHSGLIAVLTQIRADPDLFSHVRFALFSWTLSERYTLSVIGRRRSR